MTTATTPTSIPSLTSDVVMLKNLGGDFSMKYGPTNRVTIPAGKTVHVPAEIAAHFLGRWWLRNEGRFRDRADEVDRLRVLYGAYEDNVAWEQNRPRFEAYTDSGDRITTVVDDPTGEAATGSALITDLDVEQRLRIMQERQDELQRQLDEKVRGEQAEVHDPGADAPLAAPTPTPGVPPANLATLGDTTLPVAPGLVSDLNSSSTPPAITDPAFAGTNDPTIAPEPADSLVPEGAELPPRLPVTAEPAGLPPGAESVPPGEAESVPDDTPTRTRVGNPLGGDQQ